MALAAGPALAQENDPLPTPREEVPVNEDAELVFDQALEAFEEGNYGMANRRFRLVVRDYPLHRKTTAALLMAGKALYRDGQHEQAEEVLSELITNYPSSSYLDVARRVRRFARQQQERSSQRAQVTRLGVLLPPIEGESAARTQALFNGIRLAVDEVSGASENAAVQMIFRNTGGSPGEAREATSALISEEVDAIIGPLYSEAAVAAGRVAEQAEVVLMAPMATDEVVSQNRRYVFQANPTLSMRGRLMARFAERGLMSLDRLGVVVEAGNADSEQMAEAFQVEARELGNEPALRVQLPNREGWYNLPSQLTADTLQRVDALYMPVSGDNATRLISAALSGLDRLGQPPVRVLGNSTWHDLPIKQQASQYKTTYAMPFYVQDGQQDIQGFRRRYEELAGEAPARLAFTGYDVARYLLASLRDQQDRSLREALRAQSVYQGLGLRIGFEGGNVNEAMYYLRYRSGQVELLR